MHSVPYFALMALSILVAGYKTYTRYKRASKEERQEMAMGRDELIRRQRAKRKSK